MRRKKVYIRTLGCPKNEVDSEVIAGLLLREGIEVTSDPEEADLLLINTCTFIDDAKDESIEAVLEAGRVKGKRKLLVAGCLAERYGDELLRELPEADAIVGVRSLYETGARARALLAGRGGCEPHGPGADGTDRAGEERLALGVSHTAYLKIAEGCDRPCAFCSIPSFRGGLRSRSSSSLEREARGLVLRGARELVLVAEDTAAYGSDRGGGESLATLLDRLAAIEGARWLRILYAYPSAVDDSLIDRLANGPACRYLDMPIQHVSDSVLRAMRRGMSGRAVREVVGKLRERVPGVALRTSVLVGYPGETEGDFEELARFVEESAFRHLGVFRFSPQEGTAAAALPEAVPEELARERAQRLLDLQEGIVEKRNAELLGTTTLVLIDAEDEEGTWARTEADAPEIDGAVLLPRGGGDPGDFVRVRIDGAAGETLFARPVE
jgi:ribosomal protein S12 methylthiotransferase